MWQSWTSKKPYVHFMNKKLFLWFFFYFSVIMTKVIIGFSKWFDHFLIWIEVHVKLTVQLSRMCVCVCVCARARARACVRACVKIRYKVREAVTRDILYITSGYFSFIWIKIMTISKRGHKAAKKEFKISRKK